MNQEDKFAFHFIKGLMDLLIVIIGNSNKGKTSFSYS